MQTILGASGTIGTILAKELSSYTDKVRLVSRNPKRINDSDELFPADLADPSAIDKAVEGSGVVYLVVGLDYKLKVWQDRWPVLMRSVIDACVRYNAKLVFFDNVYLYDKNAVSHMTEESEINPASGKGTVRRQVAGMLMDEVRSGRLKALIARAADFYGPGGEGKIVVNELVLKNLQKGRSAMWFMVADKVHSFTFYPDAARATAILGNTDDAYGQVWHLPTSNEAVTVRDLVKLFAEEFRVTGKIMVLKIWMLKILGLFIPVMREMPEMMYQYDRDYFFDSSKFKNRFGFSPVTYREGVRISCKKEQEQINS